MASPRDPLAVFDDDVIEATTDDADVDEATLRAVACAHQEGVRDLPGVDDIVYEWRNQFHMDPLVHRSPEVYVLALQDHVWTEFADSLDLDDPSRKALKSLHDRQAQALVDATGRLDSDDALVLTRP